MKRFFLYITETVLIALAIVAGMFFVITTYPKDVFHSSYQSVIQDKFRVLREIEEPKIIMVSGSSSAFGLNEQLLEDETGYKVANLGLYIKFGELFYTELSKANLNPGDIVLLGYEYDWYDEESFTAMGTDYVMSGIDSDVGMYRFLPVSKIPSFLGYLPTFAEKKNSFEPVSGVYSRESFDNETGRMTLYREGPMEYVPGYHAVIDVSNAVIAESTIQYLRNYKALIESKGARVYFVAPPLIVDAVGCPYEAFQRLKEEEEGLIEIPYISDPEAYFYPAELMYDDVYHCNSDGERIRTEMLVEDLRHAGALRDR